MKVFGTRQRYLRRCARKCEDAAVPTMKWEVAIADMSCELIANNATENSAHGVQQINIYENETKNLKLHWLRNKLSGVAHLPGRYFETFFGVKEAFQITCIPVSNFSLAQNQIQPLKVCKGCLLTPCMCGAAVVKFCYR